MTQETGAANLKQYFEQELPRLFAEKVGANPPPDMEGEEYRLVYDLGQEKYGLRVRNGNQLEVVPGGLDEPHLHISLTPAGMAEAIAGGNVTNGPLFMYNNRKKLDKIKNFKGLFKLVLTRDDDTTHESTTIFNGTSEPAVTLKAKASDYAAIQSGKMNGQMALMTGKLKFEGSLPFLMVLSSLNQ